MNIALKDQNKQSFGLGASIEVKGDASNWLRDNMNIEIDKLPLNEDSSKITHVQTNRRLMSAKATGRRNMPSKTDGGHQSASMTLSHDNLDYIDSRSK